jgi:hypothetical protein
MVMRLLMFFIGITAFQLGSAQVVNQEIYDVNTPVIASSLDPERKIGPLNKEFVFNQQLMKNASFTVENYIEGELQYERRLNLPIDEKYADIEELQLAQFYNFYQPPADTWWDTTADELEIKADTIAYAQVDKEVLFYSDKDNLLGELDEPDASLHYIYFKNEGKIIGRKSVDTFIKFLYDDAGNITQTMVYRALPHVTDVTEPVEYNFIADPTDYTVTTYDAKNRIKSQWTSIDESMFADFYLDDSFLYDFSHLLEYDEYEYNNKDQIIATTRVYYYLKKDWATMDSAFLDNKQMGDLHPDWNNLDRLLHSKKTEIYTYEYGDNGRITQRTVQVMNSFNDIESWVETSNYTAYDNTTTYTQDQVTEEYFYQNLDDLDGSLLEQGFVKVIYDYNTKGTLFKKEIHRKENKDDDYTIESREELKFD